MNVITEAWFGFRRTGVPPQLTFGQPIDFSADVPIIPPFAMFLTIFASGIFWKLSGRRLPLLPNIPLAVRVAALAVGVATAYILVNQAGNELKAAGSGTLFVPVGGLATGGLYEITRNPMYCGLVFCALPACAVLFNSAWPILLAPILWSYLHFVVVAAEEALLSKEFGASYSEFTSRVPRWLL